MDALPPVPEEGHSFKASSIVLVSAGAYFMVLSLDTSSRVALSS
jgi:hypothetical protein